MSVSSKLMGLAAGLSAVAVIGVAVAQGNPPDDRITNHPIAAGQQSSHRTPMGETGVHVGPHEMRTAEITVIPEAQPVAVAPEPVQQPQTTELGAGPAPAEPAPAETVAAAPVVRADRN